MRLGPVSQCSGGAASAGLAVVVTATPTAIRMSASERARFLIQASQSPSTHVEQRPEKALRSDSSSASFLLVGMVCDATRSRSLDRDQATGGACVIARPAYRRTRSQLGAELRAREA